MHRLIYLSHAVAVSELDIDSILEKSIKNNEHSEISGCLVLNEGLFLQVLEGPEDSVRETFERIKVDPRHRDVEILLTASVTERIFGQWAMTFRPVERLNEFEALRIKALFSTIKNPTSATEILNFFQQVRSAQSLSLIRSA